MSTNTVKNGKGRTPEKGVNWKKYWESEYWDTVAKNKATKSAQTVSEYFEPAELTTRQQSDVRDE